MTSLEALGRAAAVADLCLGVASTLPATAAPTQPSIQRGQEYLQSSTDSSGLEIRTVGEDQCSKPLGERKGAWLCMPNDGAVSLVTTKGTAAASDPDNYCKTYGLSTACWHVWDDFTSKFSADAPWGYEKTNLGSCSFYFELQMVGGQNRDKPVRFNCTTKIHDAQISSDRLYYSSAYPGGNSVNSGAARQDEEFSGEIGAGVNIQLRESTGYRYLVNSISISGTVHEFSWEKDTFPGYWYAYAKSVKSDKNTDPYDGSIVYVNRTASYVGSSAYAGGYKVG